MSTKISEETIYYVSVLAQLQLDENEQNQAKIDMERMLDYVDMLKTLNTDDVDPMVHALKIENVDREDIIYTEGLCAQLLENAPVVKDNSFVVPRVFD